MVVPRLIEPVLRARLRAFRVVVLTGARQTGKSTLVQKAFPDRRYLSLDDYDVLDQAHAAPSQLLARGDRITIDEVQRAPELLHAIKREVDTDPQPGRFLLTGSANLRLMRAISETLAGRAAYLTLRPLTASELAGDGRAGKWDVLLDQSPDRWREALTSANPSISPWKELVRQGGYPEPALRMRAPEDAADRTAWYDGYMRTYLERDIHDLSAVANLIGFRRLVRVAAARVGGLVNKADLARDAGLPPTTAQRYLHLLEASYQLVPLEPYSVNVTKRLVKSPKLYWMDAGLALHLAQSGEPQGAHLENLVLNDLLAWRETRSPRPNVLFWRTSSGAEVDLVIESPNGSLVPIEAKADAKVRGADAKGLHAFMAEYPKTAPAGLLIYGGSETYWISNRVLAVPRKAVL